MSKKVLTADNLQIIKNVFNQLYMTREVDVDTETYQVSIYKTDSNLEHLDFFVTKHMWASYDDPFIGDNSGGKNVESYISVRRDAFKEANYFSEPDNVPNIGSLNSLASQYETAKTALSEEDLKKLFSIIFDALNKFAFSTKFIYQPDTTYSYPHQIDSGIGYFVCSYYTGSGSKTTWIDSFDSSNHPNSPETLASSLNIYVKKISQEKIVHAALGASSDSASSTSVGSIDNLLDKIIVHITTSGTFQDYLQFNIAKESTTSLINQINDRLSQMGMSITVTRDNFNTIINQLLNDSNTPSGTKNQLLFLIAWRSMNSYYFDDANAVIDFGIKISAAGLISGNSVIDIFDSESSSQFDRIELTWYTD